jgi:hypothetical protein
MDVSFLLILPSIRSESRKNREGLNLSRVIQSTCKWIWGRVQREEYFKYCQRQEPQKVEIKKRLMDLTEDSMLRLFLDHLIKKRNGMANWIFVVIDMVLG